MIGYELIMRGPTNCRGFGYCKPVCCSCEAKVPGTPRSGRRCPLLKGVAAAADSGVSAA